MYPKWPEVILPSSGDRAITTGGCVSREVSVVAIPQGLTSNVGRGRYGAEPHVLDRAMTHPGCCPLMTRLVDLRIAGFLKLVTSARVAWWSSALWQRVLRRRGTGFALHGHPERVTRRRYARLLRLAGSAMWLCFRGTRLRALRFIMSRPARRKAAGISDQPVDPCSRACSLSFGRLEHRPSLPGH